MPEEIKWKALAEKWARYRGWREITEQDPWPSVQEPRRTEGWTNGKEARCPDFPPFDQNVAELLRHWRRMRRRGRGQTRQRGREMRRGQIWRGWGVKPRY